MACFFLIIKKKEKVNNNVVLYLAVRRGCEHTHTVKEETLRAVGRGCGLTHTFLRGRIISLHVVLRMCGYGYSPLCRVLLCRAFLCVRASLPPANLPT